MTLARALLALALLLPVTGVLAQFDHQHKAWTTLLAKHVVLVNDGKASQVRYGAMAQERVALKAYLDTLATVPEQTF